MSQNPENLLRQARRMQEAGDTAKAREMVIAALKLDRANAEAWHMAAMLTDDEREKCEALRRALGLAPDNAELRQLYNSLECDNKIKKTTTTVKRAEINRSDNSVSTMMVVLLFVLLGIVVVGAGAAFLATRGSDSMGQPSDAQVANVIRAELVELGQDAPIDPSAIDKITVQEAHQCDVSEEDAADGITDKWIYVVEITYLEGSNPFWSDRLLPPSWPIYARDGKWVTERRPGTCIVGDTG